MQSEAIQYHGPLYSARHDHIYRHEPMQYDFDKAQSTQNGYKDGLGEIEGVLRDDEVPSWIDQLDLLMKMKSSSLLWENLWSR